MFPSLTQLIIVFLIIVILFGVGKLPKISADIAKSIKTFKNALNDDNNNSTKNNNKNNDDNNKVE